MKKNKLFLLVLAMILAVSMTACGGGDSDSGSSGIGGSSSSSGDSASYNKKAGKEDSSVAAARSSEKGSFKELRGKYTASGDKNTIYVFADDALSKIEKGSYIIRSAGKIRMSYGTMKKSTYRVKASNGDTNFISKDNSFPTRFLAGKDGATKSKAFDGTYGVNGSSSWRLVFQKDGTFSAVQDMECKVDGAKVKIAGTEYTWKAKKNKVVIKNKHKSMTLVAAE